MRIVKFKGGLGNQMFQYAFGKRLLELFGGEVAFDCQTERLPEICELSADCNFISEKQAKKAVRFYKFRKGSRTKRKLFAMFNSAFNSKYYFEKTREEVDVTKLNKKQYFDGYWQCWKYLENQKENLKKEFFPKGGLSGAAQKDIAFISQRETVCLGIRLGDYTAEQKHYMVCGADYYRKAIEYCLQHINNPLFYVFSNDVEGAKAIMSEFADRADVIYREEKDVLVNYEEMWVMAACRHAIIPNSTFHWWAAWLKDGGEHIITAPEKWFGDGKKIDIVPCGWIRI
ncbi:MAG: alpha-1,2-fucosyltransferase [Clostridia bacterium]|nr:alpha-1,2-fucosyltransferase [Clostridia bacterium]